MNESARPSVISETSLREIQQYACTICRAVRPTRVRYAAEEEYVEHVEDHVYRLMLNGVPEQQAVKQAIEALGDSESLCHMLCAVHNRVPPGLGKNLFFFALRALGAWLIWQIMPLFANTEKYPFLVLIPILLTFGLAPFRLVRSLVLRIRNVARLSRLCRKLGFRKQRQTSPILSVIIPTRRPEWMIETPQKTYCVHFLAVHNRHACMRLLDSFAYTLTTVHGQGARFWGRHAGTRFFHARTGDLTYENQSIHTLHFPLRAEEDESQVERILLLCPVPSEIQYLKGSVVEHAGNGDRVYDFTLYDTRSFAALLKNQKENLP